MAINGFRRIKLQAMSFPGIDIRKAYKLQRTYLDLTKKKTNLHPLFRTRETKVVADGREILYRIYEPIIKKREKLLVFFHGGGWVTESIDTYNHICATLAGATGCRVISVEYRLAPEFPFPCGLDDCYDVVRDIISHPQTLGIKPENIVLIGDSAGGNFAAVLSMAFMEMAEFRIARQVLLYPALYNDHTEASPFKSVKENGEGYMLTARHVTEYMDLYVPDKKDLNSPYVAPLLAESFEGLPKTLVITAEFDPLRDEGEFYGRQVKKAGGYAEIYRMRDAVHGFLAEGIGNATVRRAYSLINRFLDRDFS